MESKAHIQRKGSNWEVKGFKVRLRPDSKGKESDNWLLRKYAKKTLLRKQLKFES